MQEKIAYLADRAKSSRIFFHNRMRQGVQHWQWVSENLQARRQHEYSAGVATDRPEFAHILNAYAATDSISNSSNVTDGGTTSSESRRSVSRFTTP